MSKKLDCEYLEKNGFRQLGNRPIWSNVSFQLHQYLKGFGVFKRSDNNVLYEDTGKTLFTRAGFIRWRENLATEALKK